VKKYHIGQRVEGMNGGTITGVIVAKTADNGGSEGPGLITVDVSPPAAQRDEPELVSYSNPTIRKAIKKDGYEKHEISYTEVTKATNNLEEIIGEGSFATVYSGVLLGKEVAVKVEKERGDEAKAKQAFINEIKVEGSSRSIVSIVGCHTAVANMYVDFHRLCTNTSTPTSATSSLTPSTKPVYSSTSSAPRDPSLTGCMTRRRGR
jgi:hypothetical protein